MTIAQQVQAMTPADQTEMRKFPDRAMGEAVVAEAERQRDRWIERELASWQ